MNGLEPLVVFRLEAQRYALALPLVERIVRAAEVTPLPQAPAIVHGAIDIGGRVLPVIDVRRRLGLPARAIAPADQFLIAQMTERKVVLAIDEVLGVLPRPSGQVVPSGAIAPGLEHVHGVMQLDDGLVLIQDLDKLLSLEEVRELDRVMSEPGQHVH